MQFPISEKYCSHSKLQAIKNNIVLQLTLKLCITMVSMNHFNAELLRKLARNVTEELGSTI
jgi:hypothetical protein